MSDLPVTIPCETVQLLMQTTLVDKNFHVKKWTVIDSVQIKSHTLTHPLYAEWHIRPHR